MQILSIICKQELLTFGIAIHLEKASRVLGDPMLTLRELNKFIKIQAERVIMIKPKGDNNPIVFDFS